MLHKFLCRNLFKNWNWYLGGSFVFYNISINGPEEREYEYSLPMILISPMCWNVKSTGVHFKISLSVWVGKNVADNRGKCKFILLEKITEIILHKNKIEGAYFTFPTPPPPNNYWSNNKKTFKPLKIICLNYWNNMVIWLKKKT